MTGSRPAAEDRPTPTLSRRRVLASGAAAAGAAVGAVALTGCGSISVPPQKVAVMTDADARGATLFGGLETLAVSIYQNAVTAGAVSLPPAVTGFATTARGHHQRALDQWNGALALTRAAPVTQPPASVKATVDQAAARVTDAKSFARLALLVEQMLSDTYLATMPKLVAKSAVTLAGAFQVVDAAHVAWLHFLLGEYPIPDAFQKADHAVVA